ncbi:MAG: hypothetical protein LQ347_004168 [Umbilicaria vellea]|nr:MAG: hypothetical protein LQ347_004168 [Umbilicaria vellea]
MPERIRLHISPLNPELLEALIPPSVLLKASDISYHSLQTFPDRKYGYIELPAMEAEKIKKKFNGSILKGHKVRVEEARPKEKTKRPRDCNAVDEAGKEHTAKKARKTKAKQKPGDSVLPGYELPQSRKVKRGWTESKADKILNPKKDRKEKKAKAKASSLTGQPECLFRTMVPPTAAKASEVTSASKFAAKLDKKGRPSREVVVHEFSNTTKHGNFLRENQITRGKKSVSEYVDGKGWVDKNGDIVEVEPLTHRPRLKPKEITAATYNNKTVLSGDVSNSSQSDSSPEDQHPKLVMSSSHHEVDDKTSSSGTSSSSDSQSEDIADVSKTLGEPITSAEASNESSISSSESDKATEEKFEESNSATQSTSRSASSMSSDKEANATPKADHANTEAGTERKEVHPLEALFKRPRSTASSTPRKPTLEVRTSFSFFDSDAGNETSRHLTIPQTPFTQRDIQDRRLRSAAPTPDTAAPGKTFANVWAGHPDNEVADEDEDEDEDGLAEPDLGSKPLARKGSAPNVDEKGKPPESDFAKWFWEHRGETNRAWKKRRREAAKEQRQRENRRRGRSAI